MEESVSMEEIFEMRKVNIKEYSPLTLAYIGDAVYDLIIRTLVVNKGNQQVQKLHKETITMVQASAQARHCSERPIVRRRACGVQAGKERKERVSGQEPVDFRLS